MNVSRENVNKYSPFFSQKRQNTHVAYIIK
nr:MAG TPA: hypothetical protein [Microviridae sp.]